MQSPKIKHPDLSRWFEKNILSFASEVEKQIVDQRVSIEKNVEYNQCKVLRSMQTHRVSDFHFSGSTGYGYNDRGREVIDAVYADVFGAEAALVRPQMVSGTHAIAAALFGVLRPGDELLFVSGKPYDTLSKLLSGSGGSLQEWGVTTSIVPLNDRDQPDYERIRQSMRETTKVVAIQRSRGYEWRPSLNIQQIAELTTFIKSINEHAIVFVDNCYGEFVETIEPTEVGVDLMAGSLIKNPGGGLALTGGYIAGRKVYVELAANRLTAPGISGDVGAMLNVSRSILQGLFVAPHVVGQALQGAVFAAAAFAHIGLETSPAWNESRTDIIQAIRFKSETELLKFVQCIQHHSPVDSHVTPEPWNMPGYEHPVVMAAGTFIQGGSLELSADAPIRTPYIAYFQGGLTYSHVKLCIMSAVSQIFRHMFDK